MKRGITNHFERHDDGFYVVWGVDFVNDDPGKRKLSDWEIAHHGLMEMDPATQTLYMDLRNRFPEVEVDSAGRCSGCNEYVPPINEEEPLRIGAYRHCWCVKPKQETGDYCVDSECVAYLNKVPRLTHEHARTSDREMQFKAARPVDADVVKRAMFGKSFVTIPTRWRVDDKPFFTGPFDRPFDPLGLYVWEDLARGAERPQKFRDKRKEREEIVIADPVDPHEAAARTLRVVLWEKILKDFDSNCDFVWGPAIGWKTRTEKKEQPFWVDKNGFEYPTPADLGNDHLVNVVAFLRERLPTRRKKSAIERDQDLLRLAIIEADRRGLSIPIHCVMPVPQIMEYIKMGEDPYRAMAGARYGKDPREVTRAERAETKERIMQAIYDPVKIE